MAFSFVKPLAGHRKPWCKRIYTHGCQNFPPYQREGELRCGARDITRTRHLHTMLLYTVPVCEEPIKKLKTSILSRLLLSCHDPGWF